MSSKSMIPRGVRTIGGPPKCYYTKHGGQWHLIPGCWGSVHATVMDAHLCCTCDPPIMQFPESIEWDRMALDRWQDRLNHALAAVRSRADREIVRAAKAEAAARLGPTWVPRLTGGGA